MFVHAEISIRVRVTFFAEVEAPPFGRNSRVPEPVNKPAYIAYVTDEVVAGLSKKDEAMIFPKVPVLMLVQ
jgi:hypothetical protein